MDPVQWCVLVISLVVIASTLLIAAIGQANAKDPWEDLDS